MKKWFPTASVLALASTTIYLYASSPNMAAIQRLESSLTRGDFPKHHGSVWKLADYARYYAGYTDHGHKFIAGEFLRPAMTKEKAAGIHIVPLREALPVIFDGGCSVINVTYDVDAAKIESITCNGEA